MFKVIITEVHWPVGINLLKVNNRNTIFNFTPCSSVYIVNFEHVIAGWVRTSMI